MNDDRIIIIHTEINIDEIKRLVENATSINDDSEFFKYLTNFYKVKDELSRVEDEIKSVEAEVKNLINSKAKNILGDDWTTIKGNTFKITRSKTGPMFEKTGKVNKEFLNIKETVNSSKVKEYIIEHDNKLPDGIEYNDQRGESIRVKVHYEDN